MPVTLLTTPHGPAITIGKGQMNHIQINLSYLDGQAPLFLCFSEMGCHPAFTRVCYHSSSKVCRVSIFGIVSRKYGFGYRYLLFGYLDP